jgi:ligand-binding sensor domain-containing protein
LPSNDIFCIAIEQNGTKWIGTDAGLATYDGSWTVYNTSNSGLPSNNITCIAIEENGTKWIGTTYGLAEFYGTNWTVYNRFNSPLTSYYISSIAIDENGTKWIGTISNPHSGISGCLAEFDGIVWTIYQRFNSGLPGNNISTITIDMNGIIWIGTHGSYPYTSGEGGLVAFDDSTWTLYNSSNSGLPYDGAVTITIDEEGTLWIGCGIGSLALYNEGDTTFGTYEKVEVNQAIHFYPNPVKNKLIIKSTNQTDLFLIEIFSLQGILVDRITAQSYQTTIDLGKLKRGLYILRIYTEEGIYNKKVIKE